MMAAHTEHRISPAPAWETERGRRATLHVNHGPLFDSPPLARGRRYLAVAALGAMVCLLLPVTLRASDEHGHDAHDEHAEHAFTVHDFEEAGVRLATAGPGEVDIAIELPGEVRPNADRIAHISPRFPGIVREVRRHVGDQVRAGDVLAIIESENLASLALKTAIDGTIIDKHIAAGEAVSREEAAFIVADLSTVWVNISIYQSALHEIHVGQTVTLTASHGRREAAGTISYIAPIVDQATRTAGARVVLANPDGGWRPGLFVTASVHKPAPAAVVIARDALQTAGGVTVVYVAEDDHFIARPVTVGRTGRARAEIVAGLSPGERFATERSFLVKAELGKSAAGHDH